MSLNFHNRFAGLPDDERNVPPSKTESSAVDRVPMDSTERRQTVKQRLSALGSQYQTAQIEIAMLLLEVHREQYWRYESETFEAYVQETAGISLRTAQELLRVIRACQTVNLSTTEITRLGWSKLAVVAQHLTPENATALLAQVEQTSYRQLKQSFSKSGSHRKNPQSTRTPKIILSQVIQDALRLACTHTHDVDVQPNLEFMAQKFLETVQPASRFPRADHLN